MTPWVETVPDWCWDATIAGVRLRVFETACWTAYNTHGMRHSGFRGVGWNDYRQCRTVADAKAAAETWARGLAQDGA